MKTITLENGETRQVSEEKYQELLALRLDFAKVVEKRMMNFQTFTDWKTKAYSWLINQQSREEFNIYLHMLLWKETYDKEFVPDWEDNGQIKWYIYYIHTLNDFVIDWGYTRRFNMQVYVSSRKKAEQMLNDLKAVGVI